MDTALVSALAIRDGLQHQQEYYAENTSSEVALEDYQRLYDYVQNAVAQQFTYRDTENPRTPAVRARFRNIVSYAVQKLKIDLKAEQFEAVQQKLFDEILGYGPLEKYFFDPEITDIIVYGTKAIRYIKHGKRHLAEERFESVEQGYNLLQRMIAPTGRRLDVSTPRVNTRLFDGSRLIAQIAPVALDGFYITIRRFRQDLDVNALIRNKAASPELMEFLRAAVVSRQNIVVAGGTSSGKTTWLNCLASFIPEDESIITIEDTAELQLQHPDVRRMESRPANIQGTGLITLDDLEQDSLRMTPDRIIVGECRGPEAFSMLQAMNTGHEGSMTTVHANSAWDTINRIKSMVMMHEAKPPNEVALDLIHSAVSLIVFAIRDKTGRRRIDHIVEIGDKIVSSDGRTQDIELNLLWQYQDGDWKWVARQFIREESFVTKGGWLR